MRTTIIYFQHTWKKDYIIPTLKIFSIIFIFIEIGKADSAILWPVRPIWSIKI